MTIEEQLRMLIRGSRRSQNDIARCAQVDVAQLNRFLLRKKGLSLRTMDKLCAELNLKLSREYTK